MLISEVIKELQNRLELYGDAFVVYRDEDTDPDIDVNSVYYDEDAERCILSDAIDPDYE
jgi:hypothetical protein